MKDQLKREIASLLPEDTSTDLITRLASYVEGKMGDLRGRIVKEFESYRPETLEEFEDLFVDLITHLKQNGD